MEVKTLKGLLIGSAGKYQNTAAFQTRSGEGYRKITYSEALGLSKKLVRRLEIEGVVPGDRVGVLSENRPEWGISYLSAVSMGAVVIPLDAMLNTDELEYIINDSGLKVIVISKGLQEKHKFSRKTFLMDDIAGLQESSDRDYPVSEDDIAAILYTSGTTGNPKGVMLTHKNIMSNISTVTGIIHLGPGDNFLSVLPLHHTFEATCGFLGPLYKGATITYAETLKSHALLKNMQETGVTVMCGVPLLYSLFYDGILRQVEEKGAVSKTLFSGLMAIAKALKPEPIRRKIFSMIHKKLGGHIRFWVSGGAAIDPDVIRGFEVFGITILQGYGLTETAPILTCCTLEHNRVGSVGRAIPGVELKLSPEGEILAKGPNVMKGYYKRQDLTDEVIKDGWFHTGDIGMIDADGYVFITGRCKDIIVTGSGVNVAPDEIEFHLKKIPGIKECCIVGARAEEGIRRGMEEVMAVIVPDHEYLEKKSGGQKPKPEEVEGYINSEVQKLNQRLAEFKRIARVIIRSNDLPKTSTRKVKRYQVKKEMGF